MITNLSLRMKKLGIRGVQIARALSVSEGDVSKWKQGWTRVPPKHQAELASLVGVPVDQLLDERGLARLQEDRR